MITSKFWLFVDGLASARSGGGGAAYECNCVMEIFDFLFRLSLAYTEAGSEHYDGFLAAKRGQEKYLEAWLRQYNSIVLQAKSVCLGRAPRSRAAARPVSACMRNLEGDYLVGMLCAIGNEILDEVDGSSGMSALLQRCCLNLFWIIWAIRSPIYIFRIHHQCRVRF